MGGKLPQVVAAARNAIERSTTPGEFVLVACSGGADSLALAAAAAFLKAKRKLQVGAVIVDHRMQKGSAEVAANTAAQCTSLGLDPVLVMDVEVAHDSEQWARTARYAAFERAREKTGASRILLGHTLDDQAEQVLLGLARGSGTLSLAGMPAHRGPYLRPLLGMNRAAMEEICAHAGLDYWVDPTNREPKYLRNRVRHQLMPALKDVLGSTVPEALARTAVLARKDAEYLDELAAARLAELGIIADPHTVVFDARRLRELPDALRGRVLRMAVTQLGAPAPTFERLEALEALLFGSQSAGPIQFDGHAQAVRIAADRSVRGSTTQIKISRNPPTHG